MDFYSRNTCGGYKGDINYRGQASHWIFVGLNVHVPVLTCAKWSLFEAKMECKVDFKQTILFFVINE